MTVNTSTTYHHASQVEQYGVIDEKSIPSVKLAIAKNRERRNPILLYVLFSVCVLLLSCNPDRPNFEPSYSGAPPEEDLDQYLDTKAVFIGLDEVKGVRNQLDSLLTLTDKLKNYDHELALIYADTSYSIATQKNWQLSRGIASYYIALLKGRREKYGEGIEDALVDANISKQIFEDLEEDAWTIRANNLIGIFYEGKKDLDNALKYLYIAMELLDTGSVSAPDSIVLRGELLHDFGNVYILRDTALANVYFTESLKNYKTTNNKRALTRLKFDMAQLHIAQKKFARAEAMIFDGIVDADMFSNTKALIAGYQKLGLLYSRQYRESGKQGDFSKSMINYQKCFDLQTDDIYFLHNQIGQNYQRAASVVNDEELAYSYVDSAILSYKKAMDEARIEGVLHVMKKMGRNISQLCEWRSRVLNRNCRDILNTSSADLLNTNYAALTDTIGRVLQMANKRNRAFETGRLEVKNEQKTRIQWIISGAGLLFVAMVFIVLLQRQQQKRLKAKMAALRAQINPHFISNSLNAIEGLVNLDKKEEAAKYLIHFSRLSRRILNSSREGNASLAEEIQTLEHFLALEQLRFRDKLQYLIDIDEDLNPKQIEIPAMLLQPYVENAIWHGIKPKAGKGLLKIQVEREGKHLICIIKDDGVGRTKSAEIKSASVLQQKSVAMKINQERLKVVGGAKGAKVDIVDLYDESGAAAGTKVIIRLPYKEIRSK